MAIGHAVNFQQALGTERKQKRLHYLKNYWLEKCLELPGFSTQTSLKPEFSGALASFLIQGLTPVQLAQQLFSRARIHTSATTWEHINGVRVTPHVYTPIRDLDRLVATIQVLAREQAAAASKNMKG
jgi:selenocysteine lyase/cysteine desulfurase